MCVDFDVSSELQRLLPHALVGLKTWIYYCTFAHIVVATSLWCHKNNLWILNCHYSTSPIHSTQLQHCRERTMKARVRLDRNHRIVIQISRVNNNRSSRRAEEELEGELNTYQQPAWLSLTMTVTHRASSTNISPKHWILAINPTKVSFSTTTKTRSEDRKFSLHLPRLTFSSLFLYGN